MSFIFFIACFIGCSNCTGSLKSDCLFCEEGYILDEASNTCIDTTCDPNKYFDPTLESCVDCETPCDYCELSATTCTSCSDPYPLLNGNTCVDNCPPGSFNWIGECNNCSTGCSACQNSSTCTDCSAGYFLNSDSQCQQCSTSCKTCSQSEDLCDTCDDLHFLNQSDHTCNTGCDEGYFGDAVSRECETCTSPCKACTDNTTCTSCPANMSLLQSSCVNECPPGFLTQDSACLPCDPSCETCSNSTDSCSACNISSYLTSDNKCVQTCPLQYYPDLGDNTCHECGSGCTLCDNSTQCTQCASGYLVGGACLPSCPSGYFQQNNKCYTCDSTCTSCIGQSSNCTSCDAPLALLLIGGQTPDTVVIGSCVSDCGPQMYNNPDNNTCTDCQDQCLTCSSSLDAACLSCQYPQILHGSNCLSSCPDGFYLNTDSKTCTPCDSTCLTCSGPLDTNCSSCNSTSFLYNSICVVNCPNGTYIDGNNCSTCGGNCDSCETAASCTSCSSGFWPGASGCDGKAQCLKYDLMLTYLIACNSSCQSCIGDINTCTSCQSPLILRPDSTCGTDCPSHYFIDGDMCSTCDDNCGNCSGSSTTCTTCSADNVLDYTNTCTETCSPGYYADTIGICRSNSPLLTFTLTIFSL